MEFATLAHSADPNGHYPGWLVSRKFNGWRCLWDGGVTLGMTVGSVPWVKNSRYLAEQSTGLWTLGRSSGPQPVFAPAWWRETLPLGQTLDGELWHDSDSLSHVKSICGRGPMARYDKMVMGSKWDTISYQVFDYKPYSLWGMGFTFLDKIIDANLRILVAEKMLRDSLLYDGDYSYNARLTQLRETELGDYACVADCSMVCDFNQAVHIRRTFWPKAEGFMLRNPYMRYELTRSYNLLKCKDKYDHEAEIIGTAPGKGKHEGRLGALKVCLTWDGTVLSVLGGNSTMLGQTVEFEIGGGFTDAEREASWKLGSTVKFTYLGVTSDGIPVSANYCRD